MNKIFFTILLLGAFCSQATDWSHIKYFSGNMFNIDYHKDSDICYALANPCGKFADETHLYKSYDKGLTWEKIWEYNGSPISGAKPPFFWNVSNVSSPDPDYYYIAYSDKGYIHKSRNGCESFDVIEIDKDRGISSLFMIDSITGYCKIIDGGEKSFFVTFDGWQTFEKRYIPEEIAHFYISLQARDSANIHFVSAKTTDGTNIIANYDIYDDEFSIVYEFYKDPDVKHVDGGFSLFFVNDTLGFLSGRRQNSVGDQQYAIIYRTNDGGNSWDKILDKLYSDKPFGLKDIAFYDEKNGFAVGAYGYILMTNDGGNSCNYERPHEIWYDNEKLYGPANSVAAFAGRRPLIGTNGGNMYAYDGDYFLFEYDGSLIRPELIKPVNNTISDPNFEWELNNTDGSYILQVSDNKDFNNFITEESFSTSVNSYNGNFQDDNILYFWRVGITDYKDTLWSEVRKFRMNIAPPEAYYPECGGTTDINFINVNLSIEWIETLGADFYKFELSENEQFTNIIQTNDSIIDEYVWVENLKNNNKYYWRVKAYNNEFDSEWSEICNFTTNSEEPPVLIYPENNTYIDETDIEFKWNGELAPTKKFGIQISKTFQFTKIILADETFDNTHKVDSFKIGEQYYWRVYRTQDYGMTMSPIYSFIIKLKPTELLSPVCNSINVEVTPTLKWSFVSNASYYELEISDNEEFEKIIYHYNDITDNEFRTEKLDSGITYFWRIKAHNEKSISNWSEIFSFTTDGPNSVSDDRESLISIKPNPAEEYIEISVNNPSEGLKPSEGSEIEIYDVLGNKVFNSTPLLLRNATPCSHPDLSGQEGNFKINVSHLPKGVYFVKIGDRVEKFVKM